MPVDYTNPNTLRFLIENFENEQERRMLWFIKNKDEIMKKASFPEDYKDIRTEDVRMVPLTICMPSLSVDYKNGLVNHLKKTTSDGPVLGVASLKCAVRVKYERPKGLVPEPVMKPIEPNVKSILYEPLPFGGRVVYLKTRSRVLPEDKYYFNETSNSVCGWGLKDSEILQKPPAYGRYNTFARDVKSRSGPHPDPAYYQIPPKEPYSKCP